MAVVVKKYNMPLKHLQHVIDSAVTAPQSLNKFKHEAGQKNKLDCMGTGKSKLHCTTEQSKGGESNAHQAT